MKDTLSWIVTHIVDTPDAVQVREESSEGKTILRLSVAPSDMGKVIGKSGRIIKALRDIMKIAAAKKNEYVDVVLMEEAAGDTQDA